MRRALLIAALLVLVAPAPAHAGALIDRAVAGPAERQRLRRPGRRSDAHRRPGRRAARPDRRASAPARCTSSSRRGRSRTRQAATAAGALREIGNTLDQRGTYVIVAGRNIRALASADVMPTGEAGELADGGDRGARRGDLDAILLDLTDRVGAERNGGGDDGGGVPRRGDRARRRGRRRRRCAAALAPPTAGARGGGVRGRAPQRARRPGRARRRHPRARPRRRDAGHRSGRPLRLRARRPALHRGGRALGGGAAARAISRRSAEALEEGRWAMASAKARMAGEEPPERRPPCFFDPRHGPSTRDVLWSPPYGQPREVPACEADALRVEQGEEPAPREIEWGGRRVPYWQAGAAYAPYAGGYFGGFGGGLLPGILIGSHARRHAGPVLRRQLGGRGLRRRRLRRWDGRRLRRRRRLRGRRGLRRRRRLLAGVTRVTVLATRAYDMR